MLPKLMLRMRPSSGMHLRASSRAVYGVTWRMRPGGQASCAVAKLCARCEDSLCSSTCGGEVAAPPGPSVAMLVLIELQAVWGDRTLETTLEKVDRYSSTGGLPSRDGRSTRRLMAPREMVPSVSVALASAASRSSMNLGPCSWPSGIM